MKTNHYQHKETGELIGLNEGIDAPDGYVLLSDDEFAQWKIDSEAKCYAALSYADKRRPLYPPIADFADAWVKDDKEALEAYRAACLAVKKQIPNGSTYSMSNTFGLSNWAELR